MRRLNLTEEDAVQLKGVSWLLFLVGLLSVAAGVIIVARPSHSLKTLAVVFGVFLLVDGIVELVSSLGRGVENRSLAAIVGVLGIVVGIALIRHPFHGVNAIGILIGIWLVSAGAIRLVLAIVRRTHVLLSSLIALLEIAAGIAVVSEPSIGYTTLAVLVGIWLIINGIGMFAFGFVIRAAGGRAESPAPA